jgi:hypothetical protein
MNVFTTSEYPLWAIRPLNQPELTNLCTQANHVHG